MCKPARSHIMRCCRMTRARLFCFPFTLMSPQLLRLIRSGPRRFPRRDLINLHEDLAELVGERGLVSVGQQLQIVQRVQRSYKFLSLPHR